MAIGAWRIVLKMVCEPVRSKEIMIIKLDANLLSVTKNLP